MVSKTTSLSEQVAKLEQRLQILEQKQLIAGNELRITEIDKTRVLIEHVAGESEREQFITRLEEMEDQLNNTFRPEWITGNGLTTKNNGLQRIIELDPAFINTQVPQNIPETVLDDFPFRVRLAEDQPEEGDAKNFLLCAGGYDLPEALIYAGTAEPIRVEKHIFRTAGDCCIFLRIVLDPEATEINPGVLDITIEQDSGFPPPSVAQYIVPIAKIIFKESRTEIQQMQFGNIYLSGRVI